VSFTSLGYVLFLPAVFALFLLAAGRFRWLVLLLASFLFYAAWMIPHLPVALLLVCAGTWGVGIALEKPFRPRLRKALFILGVAGNLSVLATLKYLPVSADIGWIPARPEALLAALGVSYYVFQAISYLIDIYMEKIPPERHFGYFALYMSFFPKLLQGPIERAGELLPQLRAPYRFDPQMAVSGLTLFAWGLFKKVVVADRLALFVNPVYGNVQDFGGPSLILATYFYALQLYCDFSGYTDMALGTARLFNIRLARNFNNPYSAVSVSDFWRRWHISLSRWLLDYLFSPLQMRLRRWKHSGTALALLVTFILSGIWHGVGWGFLVWGGIHGAYLAGSVYYRPLQKKLHRALRLEKTRLLIVWQRLVTFHLICFAWIFFRAESLGDAFHVVRNLPTGTLDYALRLLTQLHTVGGGQGLLEPLLLGQSHADFILALLGSAIVLSLEGESGRKWLNSPRVAQSSALRWAGGYILVFFIILFGVFTGASDFIYFRF
jgi:alginate O-acetyltransferase complex protein AlgI